jgi:hypothetical protein
MRLDDWQERLSAVLEDARTREFAYGEHDCCTHAADCIVAVTGRDVAAAWRGRYETQEAGLALARTKSLAQLARRFFRPIPPVLAHRGDVALAPIGERIGNRRAPMLLVFDHALLRGPAGVAVPRELAVKAWRVE